MTEAIVAAFPRAREKAVRGVQYRRPLRAGRRSVCRARGRRVRRAAQHVCRTRCSIDRARARPSGSRRRARRPRRLLHGQLDRARRDDARVLQTARRSRERELPLRRRRARIFVRRRRPCGRRARRRGAGASGACGRRDAVGTVRARRRQPGVFAVDRGRVDRARSRPPLPRRPLRAVHGRNNRYAQGCRLAARRHLLRRVRRRESGRAADQRARTDRRVHRRESRATFATVLR